MYVQHPYKYEGKYYAKIDGVFYEISKEVAMAIFAEYRNEIYRSRKWAPESEEDDQMEVKWRRYQGCAGRFRSFTDQYGYGCVFSYY